MADDRFSGNQIPSEVWWCVNTRIPGRGYSAYRPVFGSDPVDLFGRGDKDEYLLFAPDASLSAQLAPDAPLSA